MNFLYTRFDHSSGEGQRRHEPKTKQIVNGGAHGGPCRVKEGRRSGSLSSPASNRGISRGLEE